MRFLSRLGATAFLVASVLGGAASLARADEVFLVDGRVITGEASVEGEELVVKQKWGETRFAKALLDHMAKGEAVAAAPAREPIHFVPLGKKPPGETLPWEKDEKVAAKLAAEAKKIVLTFVVVGELGTGHC